MYRILLEACTIEKTSIQWKRWQSYVAQQGQEYSKSAGKNVVSTLVRCGALEDALQVFQRMPQKDVLSWTAMLSGYTMAGQGRQALRMYDWMHEEGVKPNSYTIVCLLKACGSIADLEEGRRIHREALKYRAKQRRRCSSTSK